MSSSPSSQSLALILKVNVLQSPGLLLLLLMQQPSTIFDNTMLLALTTPLPVVCATNTTPYMLPC